MITKFSFLVLSCLSINAFGFDTELAQKEWKEYQEKVEEMKFSIKSEESAAYVPTQSKVNMFLQREDVCVNRKGEEISKDNCEKINNMVTEIPFLSSFKQSLSSSEVNCSKTVNGDAKKKCLDWLSVQKDYYKKQINLIEELDKIDPGTFDSFTKKYLTKLNDNIKSVEQKNKEVENSEATLADAKSKYSSNNCKAFHVLVSICQKEHVDKNVKEATQIENDITKESGVINLYSRYSIAQQKAFHGTSALPKLKTDYKKLTNKEWSKELCDWDKLTNKEEKNVCGCIDDENSSSSCDLLVKK